MEFAVWLKKLKQGLCNNLEEWDGAGGGREVQKGAQSSRQYGTGTKTEI